MTNLINGTALGDDIVDTAANDFIQGLGGDDDIRSSQGTDTLWGGDGNDFLGLYTGSGVASGDAGNDEIIGIPTGNMTLLGGDGSDLFLGIMTSGGTLTVDGGAGVDRISVFNFASGSAELTGGSGSDIFVTNNEYSADTQIIVTDFTAGVGGDVVDFSNEIVNGLWNYHGGNLFDLGYVRFVQSGSDVLVQVDRDGGAGGVWSYNTALTLKNVNASALVADNFRAVNSSIFGDTGNNHINGDAGNNVILGLDGNDTLDATSGGLDTLVGGYGDDVYIVHDSGDSGPDTGGLILESSGAGWDTVLSDVSYKMWAEIEELDLLGSANTSGIGTDIANLINGNSGQNTLLGLGGDDSLNGLGGNDILYGGAGNDSLSGGSGNDTLYGGSPAAPSNGSDTLSGGDGNDIIYGTGTLNGGLGNDLVTAGSGSSIDGGGGVDFASFAGNSTEFAVLTHGSDLLVMAKGSDLAHAVTVTDIDELRFDDLQMEVSDIGIGLIVAGTASGDTLSGNAFADMVDGGDGNDVVYGYGNDDTLTGGNGTDSLYGGVGRDAIDGGDGADVLSGDAGNDTLTGGAGADGFVFLAAGDNGHDTVQDFVSGSDQLVFTGTDYGFAAGHNLTGAEFIAGSAAIGASAQFVWDAASHILYWDHDGAGGDAAIAIATFGGSATLAASDIHFG